MGFGLNPSSTTFASQLVRVRNGSARCRTSPFIFQPHKPTWFTSGRPLSSEDDG